MLDISVIILTYNEQLHIERCIKNAQQFSNEIFLVDSFSTDKTVEIAENLGAKVFQNKWENNYAKQFNWGLQNLPIKTKWVLRLDADEYLTDELIEEVKEKLHSLSEDITGIILNREQDCFGRWVHPLKLLRIFQYRKAECEQRWMDEHIQLLEGKAVEFQHKFYDHNLNTFGWWIEKHNGYSIREAVDLLDVELNLFLAPSPVGRAGVGLGKEAEQKRAKKLRYARSPLFLRSFLYFIYRYIFKFGFAKGKSQFIWDFFQGWWYRTLVDAKIYEIKRACGEDKEKIIAFVEKNYKLNLTKINIGGGKLTFILICLSQPEHLYLHIYIHNTAKEKSFSFCCVFCYYSPALCRIMFFLFPFVTKKEIGKNSHNNCHTSNCYQECHFFVLLLVLVINIIPAITKKVQTLKPANINRYLFTSASKIPASTMPANVNLPKSSKVSPIISDFDFLLISLIPVLMYKRCKNIKKFLYK